jgi:NAD-specific glutamate dehydrogenase
MKDAARHMIEIARAGSALYPPDEVAETVAFLEWLLDLNFVFLGYREYELVDLPEGRALAAVPGRASASCRSSTGRRTSNPCRSTRSSRTCGPASRAATC